MSIKQSIQTLIRADDFHEKSFSFTVESVVEDLPASQRDLVVTVSEGYHMTTSLISQPRREQAFEHIQQPNQQWVANGTVILAYAEDYPKDGVLTIQNPVAETTVLPIEAPHPVTKSSEFTISHSELSFTQTADDKPAYLLLTITHPPADTPITFTTDAPAYFQMASDSHPYYGSTLTVVSSVRKFYVHVRYAADKRGLHKGQLTIQTPDEIKMVSLEGRRTGWLSTKTRADTTSRQPKLESPKSASRSGSWIVLAILAGMSGLGYIGYTNKCQLFPGLCRDVTPKTTLVKAPLSTSAKSTVPASLPKRETKTVAYPEKTQENLTQVIDSLARLRQSLPADKSSVLKTTVASEEQPVTTRTNGRRRETDKKGIDRSGERIRSKPKSPNEESELEKALNKPL